jgi:hypothetical protein
MIGRRANQIGGTEPVIMFPGNAPIPFRIQAAPKRIKITPAMLILILIVLCRAARAIQRVKYATRTITAMAITHSPTCSQRGMCPQPTPNLGFECGSGSTISCVIVHPRL